MTEQTTETNKPMMTRELFTMTLESVGKLSDLSLRTGKKKSALVRDAIDMLYAAMNAEPPAVSE
jgi:predicted DNA-binding protein